MVKMRVGLNATCFDDRPSGANQRFLNIYGTLVRRRPDIEFVVYEPVEHRIANWFGGAANVIARVTPVPSAGRIARYLAGRTYWDRRIRADHLDVFETFHLPLLAAPECPTVFTIHDLRPIHRDAPLPSRWLSHMILRHAFAHADRVISVSDSVSDEIRAFHPDARVCTIYNGVDPGAFAEPVAQEVTAVRTRFGLPDRYALAVGHLEARKNLGVLIKAIALLRDTGNPIPLAIVGNDGGARAGLLAQIAALGLAPLVTVIGSADDDTVRALYAGCALVAFPSRYEGFGIPILEAMAANKPLVLSDTPVFRELTLNLGRYFPLDDPAAAAASIALVWSDPDERARQVAFGTQRVKDFGFDGLADQVAALYETLAGSAIPSAVASRRRAASGE